MAGAILIIDSTSWSEATAPGLREAGFVALRATDSEAAERLARRRPPDQIVIVDRPPRLDALETLHRLRAETGVPVTVVVEGDDEQRCLAAFAAGADDVAPRDCALRVLVARLRAVLRRVGAPGCERPTAIAIGEIRIEPADQRVLVRGRSMHLTPLEYALLRTLMYDPGVVYTREDLLDSVWGSPTGVVERTIDAHVWKLRRKIEAHGGRPEHIVSVPQFGYRFHRPDEVGREAHALAG